jgi:hypothetical protein
VTPADELAELARRLHEYATWLRKADDDDNAVAAQLQQLVNDLTHNVLAGVDLDDADLQHNVLAGVDLDDADVAYLQQLRKVVQRLEQHRQLPRLLEEEGAAARQVVDQHRRIVKNLEDRLESAQQAQRAHEAELDQLRQTAGSDRSTLSEATIHIADLEVQRNAATQRETDLSAQIAARDDRISELQSELSKASHQAEEHRQKAETADANARQARDDLTALQNELPRRLESARKAGRSDARRPGKDSPGRKTTTSSDGQSNAPSDDSAQTRPSLGLWAVHLVLLAGFAGPGGLLGYHVLFQATRWWVALTLGVLSLLGGFAALISDPSDGLRRPQFARMPMAAAATGTSAMIVLPIVAMSVWPSLNVANVILSSVLFAVISLMGIHMRKEPDVLVVIVGGSLLSLMLLMLSLFTPFVDAPSKLQDWDLHAGDCAVLVEPSVVGAMPVPVRERCTPSAVVAEVAGVGGVAEVAGVGDGEEECRREAAAYLGVERDGVELHSGGPVGALARLGSRSELCLVTSQGDGPVGAALLRSEIEGERCIGPALRESDAVTLYLGTPPCDDERARLVQLAGSTNPPGDAHRSAIANAEACQRATEADNAALVGRVVDGRLLCGVALPDP